MMVHNTRLATNYDKRAEPGQMIKLDEFRAGQFSVPLSSGDELPECCFACVYLQSQETDACLCDALVYFCAYSWPDKLTQTVPPCLLNP